MYFRFGGALILAILISLVGIALEKKNLVLRRAVSHQSFRREVLLEQYAAQRVRIQQLGAPARLIQSLKTAQLSGTSPAESGVSSKSTPPRQPVQNPPRRIR